MTEVQDVTAIPVDLLARELGIGEEKGAFKTCRALFLALEDTLSPDHRADFLRLYWRLQRAEEILCEDTVLTE